MVGVDQEKRGRLLPGRGNTVQGAGKGRRRRGAWGSTQPLSGYNTEAGW